MKKFKRLNNNNGLTVTQKRMQQLAEQKLSSPKIARQLIFEAELLFLLGNIIGICRHLPKECTSLIDAFPLPECEIINLEKVVQDIQLDPTQCPSFSFEACLKETPLLDFISHL